MSLSLDSIEAHLSSCSCCQKTDIEQEDFGFYSKSNGNASLVYKRFPTHVSIYTTKNGKPGKFNKVSGQSIYSGQMHPVVRSKVMGALKERFFPASNNLSKLLTNDQARKFKKVKIIFEYGVPINYGDIRMINGKLNWKPAKKDYVPRWDLSNLWPMRKSIEDCLVDAGILKDDNVGFVRELNERFTEVNHINDRYIRVIIKRQ